jgi:hypothetical protein
MITATGLSVLSIDVSNINKLKFSQRRALLRGDAAARVEESGKALQ